MLPMPGLAWQGKAALRMHEFKNLAKATHEIRAPRVQRRTAKKYGNVT
jgi:hypothetical protein